MNKVQIECLKGSGVVYFLDACVLFMVTILVYSFIEKRNMVIEFIALASIILLPLYILIFIINSDLHSKENLINNRISRIRASKFSEAEKTDKIELILKYDGEKYGPVNENELNSILNQKDILIKKIKIFETYSKMVYILVVAALCILPFLSIIGMNWRWK